MTVIESSLDRFTSGAPMYRVVILVDTAADVPEPHTDWAPGSLCMIAADHAYKILNEQGEWV